MQTLILIVTLDATLAAWWFVGWAATPVILPLLAIIGLYSQSYDPDDEADEGRYGRLYDQSMRSGRH